MSNPSIDRIRELLTPILDRSGFVVGSGRDTFRHGSLYLLGENPGGSDADHAGSEYTIAASLDGIPEHRSGFIDEGSLTSPFYRNVQFVFDRLGQDPAQVLSTNALFVRSGSSKANKQKGAKWKLCWPVHQLLLEVVRPRVVLCLGAYAFDLLKVKGRVSQSSTDPDGRSQDGWLRRDACFELPSGEQHCCALVGVPHPGGPAGRSMWPLSAGALAKLDLVKTLIAA